MTRVYNFSAGPAVLPEEVLTQAQQEMLDCHRAIQDAIGECQPLFRPPFGARRPRVLQIARGLGLEPVLWSVTAYDWSAKSPERILGHIDRQITSRKSPQGEVVLLHDGGHLQFGADRGHTVEATRCLLEKQPADGRLFVTIPELAI